MFNETVKTYKNPIGKKPIMNTSKKSMSVISGKKLPPKPKKKKEENMPSAIFEKLRN
jgi:hypothetical protein